MSRPELTLNLLGLPRGHASGVDLSPGATMLCAYLALAPAGGRHRAVAASELFADGSEASARRRLSTALWRLRSEVRGIIGVDVVSGAGGHTLSLAGTVEVAVDSARFETLVRPVLAGPPDAVSAADAARLAEAVGLHRGCLLQSCDDEWLMAHRYRIESLYVTALDYLMRYAGRRGDLAGIVEHGELALAVDPLREDLHRHLMSAYAAVGRPDLAERQFERCRHLLLVELGADPLPETVALYTRLIRGTAGPSPTIAALQAELESARREVGRLGDIVDRALEHLRRIP